MISNPLTPVTVADFSGGMTDNYFTATPNCSSLIENFWLDEDGKPYTRPGIEAFTNRIPTNSQYSRATGLYLGEIPFQAPVAVVGPYAYTLNALDAWQQIGAGASFIGKGNTDQESTRFWQGQMITAGGATNTVPNRIYASAYTPVVPKTTIPGVSSFVTQSLGLPPLSVAPTLTSTGGTGNNYVYGFHFLFEFTDYLGTTYLEQGPHVQVAINDVGDVGTFPIDISGIPSLVNSSFSNWNSTTNVKINVCRTQNNGTVLYQIAQVNNGTSTYHDVFNDTIIVDNTPIYTDGGVLDWDAPPVGAKYVTQVNDFFWWATDTFVTHSIQGAPGASPASYQQPTAEKIKGLSNIIGFPILFCSSSVYRLDGTFDEFGDGGFELREISQTAGLISNRAVVSVPGGLVFPGNGGFYFTDGYQVQKISDGLNLRYQSWSTPNMVGAYDPIKNLVTWACTQSNNTGTASPTILVTLHLNFGIKPKSTFTITTSKAPLYPTSLCFTESNDADTRFSGNLMIGTSDGYLLYHNPLCYTDPNIDQLAFPVNWTTKAIIYRYESLGMNLGDEGNRKYVVEMTAEFQNETDLAVQFLTRRDDNGPWGTLSEIRSDDGALIWGISEAAWDDDNDPLDHDWDSQATIEGKRYFPKGTLRASRRQVGLTNSYAYIAKSDDLGTSTVSSTSKTVTLDNGASAWPDYCEDYFIYFAGDGYTAGYKIKTRNSDTVVTIYDPLSALTSVSGTKWQIKGYRKNELAHLLSYTVYLDMDGTTQSPSRGPAGLING